MSGRRYYLCFAASETNGKLDKLPKGLGAVRQPRKQLGAEVLRPGLSLTATRERWVPDGRLTEVRKAACKTSSLETQQALPQIQRWGQLGFVVWQSPRHWQNQRMSEPERGSAGTDIPPILAFCRKKETNPERLSDMLKETTSKWQNQIPNSGLPTPSWSFSSPPCCGQTVLGLQKPVLLLQWIRKAKTAALI